MTELEKELISVCGVYCNDPESLTYMRTLERLNVLSLYSNLFKESNFYLGNTENILPILEQNKSLSNIKNVDTDSNVVIPQIIYISGYIISKHNKWGELEKCIKDQYSLALSADTNFHNEKYKVCDFDKSVLQDAMFLTVAYLKLLSSSILINYKKIQGDI